MLLWENAPAPAPDKAMELIISAALPLLVSVAVCVEALVPAVVVNASEDGVSTA